MEATFTQRAAALILRPFVIMVLALLWVLGTGAAWLRELAWLPKLNGVAAHPPSTIPSNYYE